MKVYRPSTTLLIFWLVIDLLLACVIIGFILMAYHLWQYFSMSLTLGDKGLILKTGILATRVVEIKYEKINTLTVHQGFLGNMLGYGNLVILAGNDVSGIVVKDIDNPQTVKAEIDSRIANK